MPLYNCKPEGDSHRITKFDSDFNVESSYLTNGRECECPAGHRDTCRHRQMLPRFLAKGAGTGQWFHNFEAKSWVRAEAEVEFEPETLGELASAASQVTEPSIDPWRGLEDLPNAPLPQSFNPTAGIPKTSFGPKDAPSVDNATWFSTVQPPQPTNLLALATPRTSLPEIKWADKVGSARNELIDEMLTPPKPLRRL